MVDLRAERNEPTRAKGTSTFDGFRCCVWFNAELHKHILKEAKSRKWTFSHMVRHLCEASIEGIE